MVQSYKELWKKNTNKLVVSLKGLQGIQLYCHNSTLSTMQLLVVMERDFGDLFWMLQSMLNLSKRVPLIFPFHICLLI